MELITLPKSKVALPPSMVKFLVTNMELHPKTIDYFRQYELDTVRKITTLGDQDLVDILHSFPSFHLHDVHFIQFITAIYYLSMHFKDSGEAQQLADTQLGTPNPKTYLEYLPDTFHASGTYINKIETTDFERTQRRLKRNFMKDLQAAVDIILTNEDNVLATSFVGKTITTSSRSSRGVQQFPPSPQSL